MKTFQDKPIPLVPAMGGESVRKISRKDYFLKPLWMLA